MRLAGQVAIVTGAGRGIGRAIAKALAKEGAQVALCARTATDIEAVVKEIQQFQGTALAIAGDVTLAPDVEMLGVFT
jgi:NAD(P)-dependent dehydrogenase (short-subunit alcohol dehydrogenase family)